MKPVANRLDEGFLACPAIEKAQRPVASVEGAVRLVLAAGKKACRDVVGVTDHTNGLDIDPDLASECKRVHCDILGVRYIEAQIGIRETSGQRRLAARPINQFD